MKFFNRKNAKSEKERTEQAWRSINKRSYANGCPCGRPPEIVKYDFSNNCSVPMEFWVCKIHEDVKSWRGKTPLYSKKSHCVPCNGGCFRVDSKEWLCPYKASGQVPNVSAPSEYQASFADKGDMDVSPGSIFGVRSWTVPSNIMAPALRGGFSQLWEGEEVEATCLARLNRVSMSMALCGCPDCLVYSHVTKPSHRAPNKDCTCGVYAYFSHNYLSVPIEPSVLGVVEGYGKVLIGTKGFRAEKAKMLALCPTPHTRVSVKKTLSSRYSVPFYWNVEEMLVDFPLTSDYSLPDQT